MSEQERRYFDLPDGRKLPLPHLPNFNEFLLPGNFIDHSDIGFLAFFDDDTRTGAMYFWRNQNWQMFQPVTRESFASLCGDVRRENG